MTRPADPKRLRAVETGRRGEVIALDLAQDRGWPPGLCNVPLGRAEADVVCLRTRAGRREGLLLEVKTSRNPHAELAPRLGKRQLDRLWRMAEVLCAEHALDDVEVALVLVTLEGDHERAEWLALESF